MEEASAAPAVEGRSQEVMETLLSQVMPLMRLAPGATSSTSTSQGKYELPREVRHWTHVRLNGADAAAGVGGGSSTGPAPLPLLDAIAQHPQPGDFTPPPGFVLRPNMNSINDSIGFGNEAQVTSAIGSFVCSSVLQRAADWGGLAPAGTRPVWCMEQATSVLLNSLTFERWTKVVASPAVDGGTVEQQQQQQQEQRRRRRRTGGNGSASSGDGHAASSSSGGSYRRLDHVLVLQEDSGRSGKRAPVAAIEVKHIPVLTQGACEPECFRPISLVDAFNDPGHSLHQRAKRIIGRVYTCLVTLGLRHGVITCWNVTWLVCLDHWDRRVMHVSRAFLASDTAPTVLRALSWLQLDALRFVTSALEQQQQQQQQQQQAGTAPPGAAPGGSEGKDGSHSSGSGACGAAGGGDRGGAQRKRQAQQQLQQQQQQQPADAMGAGGGGVDSGSGKAGRSGQVGEALLSALSSDSCAAELQRAPLADVPVGDTIAVVGVSPSTSSTSSISRSPQPVEGLPQLPPPGQQERQQLQQEEQEEEQEEQAAGAEEKPLQFLQQLGHGRDGMVFRCMYDGRPAVIKVYSWERHQVKAAAREKAVYRALAALQGSVVPKVVVTGRLDGDLRALSCLVMEPVEGGARPLSDCGYRRPFPEHVQAAAQQALRRAHAEGFQADRGGFLHGDVRLANILLVGGCGGIGGGGGGGEDEAEGSVAHKAQAEEQVRCVLLDFGSSRLDGSAEEQAAELAKLRRLLGADGRAAVDDDGDYDDDYEYDD